MSNNNERISRRRRFSDPEDRISALPDEIIHEILARLQSPPDVAKAAVVSKRWTHLCRSLPIVEVYRGDAYRPPTAKRDADAALNKLSRRPHIEAVRIEIDRGEWTPHHPFFTGFVDHVLCLAAENSSREIDINLGTWFNPQQYSIPLSFDRYRRLEVLKLQNCNFQNFTTGKKENPFAGLGRCLKILCLRYVGFSDDRTLHCMIEGASRLESLTLVRITGMSGFRIRNHPSLQSLEIERLDASPLEIEGLHCLETLCIKGYPCSGLKVSSTPNVKLLNVSGSTNEYLNDLISEFPCLELFELIGSDTVHEALKLGSDTVHEALKLVSCDKLRKVRVDSDPSSPRMIEIDAPMMTDFVYACDGDSFPTISLCQGTEDDEATSSSISFDLIVTPSSYMNFDKLKSFLNGLSRQLNVVLHLNIWISKQIQWDPDAKKQPIPSIEHLELWMLLLLESKNWDAMNWDAMFSLCHPKAMSFVQKGLRDPPSSYVLSGLEYVCRQFIEREWVTSCDRFACNCWRHQLKDVKTKTVIKTTRYGNVRYEIRLWFILTWQ